MSKIVGGQLSDVLGAHLLSFARTWVALSVNGGVALVWMVLYE